MSARDENLPPPPAKPTELIRKKARSKAFNLFWTKGCEERMHQRDLIMGDLLYVLKYGFVYKEAERSTRPDGFKFEIESSTPNSGGRQVVAVVIPNLNLDAIKICDVRWKDEPIQKGK